ncbi:hypothetical protein PISMIDRAFT_686920 [Pisolithus microcarpus 441]|uniref:Uncharacterized protein n=1 Tax=Pisolithus microcarpus 441 TaxID=765257 RepID=A0A0C9YGT8_9AGAM|nr:hypothetical protein PISMIDRAFT_686920 [Pisolithus microcarpus 441]
MTPPTVMRAKAGSAISWGTWSMMYDIQETSHGSVSVAQPFASSVAILPHKLRGCILLRPSASYIMRIARHSTTPHSVAARFTH